MIFNASAFNTNDFNVSKSIKYMSTPVLLSIRIDFVKCSKVPTGTWLDNQSDTYWIMSDICS